VGIEVKSGRICVGKKIVEGLNKVKEQRKD
jgi:hypothetical protein